MYDTAALRTFTSLCNYQLFISKTFSSYKTAHWTTPHQTLPSAPGTTILFSAFMNLPIPGTTCVESSHKWSLICLNSLNAMFSWLILLLQHVSEFSFLSKVDNALYANMHHILLFNLLMNTVFHVCLQWITARNRKILSLGSIFCGVYIEAELLDAASDSINFLRN